MSRLLVLLLVATVACGGGGDVDADGDGFPASKDCNDEDERVNPGAVERCGGGDDDCDGLVDGDDPDIADGRPGWTDADDDGYGDPALPVVVCVYGDGVVTNDADCDDTDPDVNPDAVERCGGGDENCDGRLDTADPTLVDGVTVFPDADGDGYGASGAGSPVCDVPLDRVARGGDCDDADPDRNPEAPEVCDTIDNDCDGLVDLDDPDGIADATWYVDSDGDGAGDPAFPVVTCGPVEGLVPNFDDCNDARSDVAPGAPEVCDGRDNDCDDLVDGDDPDLDAGELFYADRDGDGYGALDDTVVACEMPRGFVDNADDCADEDRLIYPGAPEICDDGIDNDCDGAAGGDCLGLAGRTVVDEVLVGTLAGAEAGAALAEADLLGDGVVDVAVGAPGHADAGRAMLLAGPILGLGTLDGDVVVDGGPGSQFGAALAWAGDLDGDGADDWAVGAPGDRDGDGAVYLFSDPLGALPASTADATVVWSAPDAGAQAGAALAAITVDGQPGLVVGVPLAEAPSVDGGEVYVVVGPVGDGALADVAVSTLRGVNLGHQAGTDVAVGDLDGDGLDDVAIGAPYVADTKGTCYVVQAPLPVDLALNTADGVWSGQILGDTAGRAIAVPGDADGDGRVDLLIGAPNAGRGPAGSGTAYLITGEVMAGVANLVGADALIDGAQRFEGAGEVLGGADTTGDGRVALLIGAPDHDDVGDGDGTVYVVAGSVRGAMSLADADGQLVPGLPASGFGSAVLGVDVNGDGWQDAVVGASADDAGGLDAGALYVWTSGGGGL